MISKELAVERIKREQDQTMRRGAQEAAAATVGIQKMALRQLRTGEYQDYESEIVERLEEPVLTAMMVSYLQGYRRSQVLTLGDRAPAATIEFAISPNQATLAYLLKLTGMDMGSMAATFAPLVFQIIQSEGAAVNQLLVGKISGLIADGAHVAEGKQVLGKVFDSLGLTGKGHGGSSRLESLFRTQSMTAYGAGRWAADQDPDIQEMLWGYEYSTVGDDRVRPEHAELDGIRLPKDDPFWDVNYPPNGFNCRCLATPIIKGTPEASIKGAKQAAAYQPDPNFAFNPGKTSTAPNDAAAKAKAAAAARMLAKKDDIIDYLRNNPGASNKEVAEMFGSTPGSVASIKSRNKKAIFGDGGPKPKPKPEPPKPKPEPPKPEPPKPKPSPKPEPPKPIAGPKPKRKPYTEEQKKKYAEQRRKKREEKKAAAAGGKKPEPAKKKDDGKKKLKPGDPPWKATDPGPGKRMVVAPENQPPPEAKKHPEDWGWLRGRWEHRSELEAHRPSTTDAGPVARFEHRKQQFEEGVARAKRRAELPSASQARKQFLQSVDEHGRTNRTTGPAEQRRILLAQTPGTNKEVRVSLNGNTQSKKDLASLKKDYPEDGIRPASVSTPAWRKKQEDAIAFVQSIGGDASGTGLRASGQFAEMTKNSRSYCSSRGRFGSGVEKRTSVVCCSTRASTSVSVHEIGHAVTNGSPHVQHRIANFLNARTEGGTIQTLNAVHRTSRYDPWEVTVKGKGLDPYSTKIYDYGRGGASKVGQKHVYTPSNSEEILSMGLQKMHEDPAGFARKDPEYFDLVLDIMRGV